jgi:replicative DNA helicase
MTQSINVPYSEEAEQAVIGAVLIHPLSFLNVAYFLKAEHFFIRKLKHIWQALATLSNDNIPVDIVTVHHQLTAAGHGDTVTFSELTQLIRNTPTSVHAETYGRMVWRSAQRRNLLQAADNIKGLACNEALSLEAVRAQAEAQIFAATAGDTTRQAPDMTTSVELYLDEQERNEAIRRSGGLVGIPTGFREVDNILGGSYRGEVTVFGGPAKVGKTTYALNIAYNRAQLGIGQVMFSTEMRRVEIVRKLISIKTGINIRTLKSADMTAGQHSAMMTVAGEIAQWPLYIVDHYLQLTPLDVERELRRLCHEHSVGVVYIDGLWQMQHHDRKQFQHRRDQEVTAVLELLRNISRNFNLPLDVVHQLRRAASDRKDKRPSTSDWAESAGVERTAHVLIGLYRESYYNKDHGNDDTEIVVMNNRNGDIGTATLSFDRSRELYANATRIQIDLDDRRPGLLH